MTKYRERIEEMAGGKLLTPAQDTKLNAMPVITQEDKAKWDAAQFGETPKGSWNAATNTPDAVATLSQEGWTLDVTVGGTSSVTGTSETYAPGDKIKRAGGVLIRIPAALVPADNTVTVPKLGADVTNRISRAQVEGEEAKGISRLKLAAPLTYKRLLTTPDSPASIVQTQISDTEISATGYANSAAENFVLFDTAKPASTSRNILSIRAKINALTTTNPAVGLAWGSLDSANGYVIRSGGQLVRLVPGNSNGTTVGDFGSSFTYAVGDEVGLDIYQEGGIWKLVAYKNGIISAPQLLNAADSPTTGNLLVCCRGSIGFSFIVQLHKDAESLLKAKSYTDTLVTPLSSAVVSLSEDLEYETLTSNQSIGVGSPVAGVATGTGNTRVDRVTVVPAMAGVIRLSVLELWAASGGTVKVKAIEKIGETYKTVHEVAVTVTTGQNLLTASELGADFILQPGQFLGFHASGGASISGVEAGNFPSLFFGGDLAGPVAPNSTSQYQLQFKASLVATNRISLKDKVLALTEGEQVLLDGLDAIQQQVDSLNFDPIVSSVFAGRTSPALSTAMSAIGTRIDTSSPIPAFVGTGMLTQVQVYCNVGGAGKVKILSKNQDNTYRLIHEVAFTFAVGLNTVPVNYQVQPGWYIGFYSASAQFSGTNVSGNFSGYATGDASGNAIAIAGTSGYMIQHKATISVSYTPQLKAEVESLKKKTRPVLYVDAATGSDTNNGESQATPFATIQKAINEAVGQRYTEIVISAGDYRETLDFRDLTFEDLRLIRRHKAVVRVMGSTKLTGWTKTVGYTNLYEAAFAGPMPSWDHDGQGQKWIFEDKNPSDPIDDQDRHPLQQGLTHRLPYTLIPAIPAGADLAATLTILDGSGSAGKYYFADGRVYLHASGSTNPASNGFSYEVATRNANVVPVPGNLAALGSLTLQGIDFYYPLTGFVASGLASFKRRYCSIYGALTVGGWRDDAAMDIDSAFNIAAGSGGDGYNQHYGTYYGDYASQDKRKGSRMARYYGEWSFRNRDDGHSDHERGTSFVSSCLFEFNGDMGIAPAQGCQTIITNSVFQGNGWASDADMGAGVGVTNATMDGRSGTHAIVIGCVSRANRAGYSVRNAGNTLELVGCVSRNNTWGELHASAGRLVSRNTLVTQAETFRVKRTENAGVIVVENDTLLT